MPIKVSAPPGRIINISKPLWVDPGIKRDGKLFGEDYINKVLSIKRDNLIGYWTISDPLGATVIRDLSPQSNNGAYTVVTLGQRGSGDGFGAGSFDGSTSFGDTYSAALNTDFDPAELTLALWMKMANAGVWTDGATRRCIRLGTDGNNTVMLSKVANNTIGFNYFAGGTQKAVNNTSIGGSVAWHHLAITASVSADEVKAYIDGVQVGVTQTLLGTWAGALDPTLSVIGATVTTPSSVWSGDLAHAALYNIALTQPQIAALATV